MRQVLGSAALGGLFAVGCGAPSGAVVDAGVDPVDAGGVVTLDAGALDAGVTDAGRDGKDAGAHVDGGVRDAGNCPATPSWNLAVNGGFECAPLSPWAVSSGTFVPTDAGHSGRLALAMTADSLGEALVGQNNVLETAAGVTYCAQVWVKGSSAEMRLEVRASPSGQGTAFSSPVASPEWVKVPPGGYLKVTAPRGELLSVLARTQNADAGDTLVVDDFELWPSASGFCDEH